jgi:DNA-binding transcriptional regulator YiaG
MNKWTAKKILNLRKEMGLTQKEFSQRLGVTAHYVYLLESDQKTPSGILQRLLDCVKKEGA